MTIITQVAALDARFPLQPGEGVDALHRDPVYSYAVTRLQTDDDLTATGLAFTLGGGNDLVCRAIELLAESLAGREIEG
ncbi:MAG: mandelate racemase, partial [Planctomycetota bacterium]